MATLSYSFCMGLLHSVWQAALLWLVYVIADKCLQEKFTPLQKKNLLFTSVAVQCVLFIFTCCIYYNSPALGLWTAMNNAGFNSIFSAALVERFTPWLFTVYFVIITAKLIKSVYEWQRFKKQFKTGLVKPPVDLKLFTTAQQFHFGIKRKVQLWLSSTVTVPLTFGFLKPVIVLPVALVNQLSLQQAETLILHELAHIKANDFLLNWFLIIAETVFFFNPFIISLCKKIRLEREKYCDITVTAFNYPPLLYAETLLKAQTVKQLQPGPAEQYGVAAVHRSQQLLTRIRFFINPANQLQHQKRKILLPLVSVLLLLVMTATVLLQLNAGSKKEIAADGKQQEFTAASSDKTFAAVTSSVLQNITEENLTKISAAVKKQQPLINKKLQQLQPLIKEIQATAEKMTETMEVSVATPVSLTQSDAQRQIVVREEQSGSKNATVKVYTVIFKDGKWILQPQWKLAAKEITAADSLKLIDTSSPRQEENTELQD